MDFQQLIAPRAPYDVIRLDLPWGTTRGFPVKAANPRNPSFQFLSELERLAHDAAGVGMKNLLKTGHSISTVSAAGGTVHVQHIAPEEFFVRGPQ